MPSIKNYQSDAKLTDSESTVEKKFKEWVEDNRGLCIKLVSANSATGIPDRLVLWPDGRAEFAEIKRYGGRLSRLQAWWGKNLERMGFTWKVIVPENTKK